MPEYKYGSQHMEEKRTTLKVRKTKELIKKKTKFSRNLYIYTPDHIKSLYIYMLTTSAWWNWKHYVNSIF